MIGRNKLYDTMVSFSLLRNIKAVLSTESPKGAITSLNGIRTLSLTWVILGHMYGFLPAAAKLGNKQYFESWLFNPLISIECHENDQILNWICPRDLSEGNVLCKEEWIEVIIWRSRTIKKG